MRIKFATIMRGEGQEFGVDAVTPVPFQFHARPRSRRVYASYRLPADLVASEKFQDWVESLPGAIAIRSLVQLRGELKTMVV